MTAAIEQRSEKFETRLREKKLSRIEAQLDGDTRRDYERRLDVFHAVEAVAPPLFLERARLKDRQDYLKRFSTNKWLWGAAIVGAALNYFDFSFGKFVLGLCVLLWIGGVIELFSVERKLDATNGRLSDLCYRWIANGISEDYFWEYGRLEVRVSNLLGRDESEAEKYRDDRDRWWVSVKAELLAKAGQQPG